MLESLSHEFAFVESENVIKVNICSQHKTDLQEAYGKLNCSGDPRTIFTY